jgi:hypothetical protein
MEKENKKARNEEKEKEGNGKQASEHKFLKIVKLKSRGL